ncbi:MAG TPA: tyrosine-type recombinase/integrase [Thermoanaerobaculia bacterium]
MLFRQTYRDRQTGKLRHSKFWSYEFRFAGTRIREKTCLESKTAARDAERARRQKLAEGSSGLKRVRPKLFRQAAAEWLATKRNTLAASSYRIEEKSLDHLLPHFGNVLVCDIEAADVARYQQTRLGEKAAGSTINLEVGTMRAVLRRSGLWARLQPDVKMLPVAENVGRALTDEEETRLLQACRESRSRALYPAFVLALDSGLRSDRELTALQWRQVDLTARRLTVGASKTAAGRGRVVPLTPRAHAVLSMWAERFPARKPEHYVFPSERYGEGGAVYDSDPTKPIGRLKEAWEQAKKRTADEQKGIPTVVCRFHDLRHSFVTRLLERGRSFSEVARLAGWSASTAVRMSYRYGHLSEGTLREAISVLDRPGFREESPENHPEQAHAN